MLFSTLAVETGLKSDRKIDRCSTYIRFVCTEINQEREHALDQPMKQIFFPSNQTSRLIPMLKNRINQQFSNFSAFPLQFE